MELCGIYRICQDIKNEKLHDYIWIQSWYFDSSTLVESDRDSFFNVHSFDVGLGDGRRVVTLWLFAYFNHINGSLGSCFAQNEWNGTLNKNSADVWSGFTVKLETLYLYGLFYVALSKTVFSRVHAAKMEKVP